MNADLLGYVWGTVFRDIDIPQGLSDLERGTGPSNKECAMGQERHGRRRWAIGLAGTLGVALWAVPAGPAAASGPDRAAIVSAAREIMEKARFCTLVTLDAEGQPQARVMDAFAPEADMTVWMATNAGTRKVGQIRADPRVTLVYFDPSGPGYVTLIARAEIRTDASEKAKHWKDEWAAFYADESRGEDFVLIRCRPIRLEVVSYAHRIASDPGAWRPAAVEFR